MQVNYYIISAKPLSGYRSHISILLLVIAILGSLLSVVHVHNRPLQIESDNDSQHQLAENDLFCPICATIVFLVNQEPSPNTRFFDLQQPVPTYADLVVAELRASTIFGRAPPFLA